MPLRDPLRTLQQRTERRVRHLMLYTKLDTQRALDELLAHPLMAGISFKELRQQRERVFGVYIGPGAPSSKGEAS